MKVQICRASGQPIKFTDMDLFTEEYRQLYDKVLQHVGLENNDMITPEKAMRAQKLLDRASRSIRAKYPTISEVTLPRSQKGWLALVEQHGPIAIAKNSETGKAALIIMDAPWE